MFEPFIRIALITSLLITSLLSMPVIEHAWHKNEPAAQTTIEQLKSTVQSALPSPWNVIGERIDQSFWPTVDTLRDRYKGYAIELAGPSFTIETAVKGQTSRQSVTRTKTAVLYFIPVWSGITRGQLTKDWDEGERVTAGDFALRNVSRPGPRPSESTIYGWNNQYLLICKHDCEIVERVARKFKISKRQ